MNKLKHTFMTLLLGISFSSVSVLFILDKLTGISALQQTIIVAFVFVISATCYFNFKDDGVVFKRQVCFIMFMAFGLVNALIYDIKTYTNLIGDFTWLFILAGSVMLGTSISTLATYFISTTKDVILFVVGAIIGMALLDFNTTTPIVICAVVDALLLMIVSNEELRDE